MIPAFFPGELLAWTPFINPLYSIYPDLDGWWLPLLIPIAFVVSLVFQGIKRPTLDGVIPATLWMTFKILFFMALICAGIQIFYVLVVPHTTTPW